MMKCFKSLYYSNISEQKKKEARCSYNEVWKTVLTYTYIYIYIHISKLMQEKWGT